jgi:NAD(P)-dependent dehydrogenase (short-subunit alcohol dehydrogenase family)
MSHQDRVYVVTGAGSGIGRVTSLLLAKKGAKLALLDLKLPPEVIQEVRAVGGEVLPLVCDVTSAVDVEAAMAQVANTLGTIDGRPEFRVTQIDPYSQ